MSVMLSVKIYGAAVLFHKYAFLGARSRRLSSQGLAATPRRNSGSPAKRYLWNKTGCVIGFSTDPVG